MNLEMKRVNDTLWEIPQSGKMRVPGRIYSSDKLMEALEGDQSAAGDQRSASSGDH
jgi:hypothetical protein